MGIMLLSHKHCNKVENEFMLTVKLNFCPQQKLFTTIKKVDCDCLTENYSEAAILDITTN